MYPFSLVGLKGWGFKKVEHFFHHREQPLRSVRIYIGSKANKFSQWIKKEDQNGQRNFSDHSGSLIHLCAAHVYAQCGPKMHSRVYMRLHIKGLGTLWKSKSAAIALQIWSWTKAHNISTCSTRECFIDPFSRSCHLPVCMKPGYGALKGGLPKEKISFSVDLIQKRAINILEFECVQE